MQIILVCNQEGIYKYFIGMRQVQMAPLLSWKSEYSVNEVELDSHHKKLFDILNSVYENTMNSLEVDCVLPVIEELSQYTRYHFSLEEEHMRNRGFQDIANHIAEHRKFSQSIKMLKSHYHGNNLEVTKELIVVLGDWLIQHVLKMDRKYSELSTGIKECTKDRFNLLEVRQ